ncbi:Histidine kinase-, DNA gyrase B-, and HSP90-like ATPase [Pseudonocardia ammonioxydans]|uniref:Histidine kinase-, DNA gyrase B-, and HSP90-like ATPase n=1 Tax=Pseudonocardia ammonioxydans TaxID=260086 RepID=A0A1I4S3V7_PSUAM|nr:ATP-binding protein [Pseudonocardia ammonioxydans]SFM59145.1 Histidine kinase-, DNA gyrase B-, and HSP90-like ATPase [Pseudonocardia ammonioxydans]
MTAPPAPVPGTEPMARALLDHACSALGLLLAVVLLYAGGRSWSLRLAAVAATATAAAFDLQVAALLDAAAGPLPRLLLTAVACAAAVAAMLLFPSPGPGRWGGAAAATAAAAAVLGVAGTAVAGAATGCVVFFGFLLPTTGLVALRARLRAGADSASRARVRLLLCASAATLVIAVVLMLVTALLVALDRPGLTLEPGGPPVALLFWFARVAATALGAAALLASGSGPRVRTAQHVFGRALAVTLVAAVAGGTLAALVAVLSAAGAGPVGAVALAGLPVAVAFRPLYLWTEAFADRLLHGTRPTPYSVLAGVTALSHAPASDAPDLDRVAEGVGRGLGATTCRLTVYRTGLRDRTYTWSDPQAGRAADGDALVRVPVRQGEEELGEIAVDREAAQGLRGDWRNLLPDIADSLGVVLHANRSAIELERQLRAALAHGERIAAARRDAVARMDAERRRVERDLHDGAQHHLVSLGLSLGLVEHLVSAGEHEQARDRLDTLLAQVDGAEAVLAETVGGVSSAVLAGQGLVAVLQDTLAGSEPPVTIEHDGVPPDRRYPDEIADTAYFCCLEAVNNARKHAAGAPVTVRIAERDATLTMTVRDEGPGFVPDPGPGTPPARGRGLRNLTVRLVAVGGTVAVRSAPGAGTTVLWSLPLPSGDVGATAATAAVAVAVAAGDTALGSTAGAQTASGQTAGGQTAGARTADRQAADRQAADRQAADGQATGEQAADGQAVDGTTVGLPAVTPAGAGDRTAPDPGGPRRPAPGGVREQVRELLGTGAEVYAGTPHSAALAGAAATLDRVPPAAGHDGVLAARSALAALEEVLRTAQPSPPGAEPLRYRVERVRAEAYELVEAELVAALHGPGGALAGDLRESAERLLGGCGADPAARLGLPPGAAPGEVHRAAGHELARWQRLAGNPASTGAVRAAAAVLVRTCERLLAG